MKNEPVVPFGWCWFESEENKSPYTLITGYTYERFSTMKPDDSAKIDEGSLIPLYTHPVEEQELLGEIAQLKHMNKNWSISEGLALQEIELMKHFLQANQLYLSFQEWKHSDSARAILKKAQNG